jgi:hypothetical protein
MRLIVRIVLLAACAVALGACHGFGLFGRHGKAEPCVDHAAYLEAQNASTLHTPEGLAPPNTKNALKIADVPGAATHRTTKDGCLDRPPSFLGEQARPPAAGASRPSPPAPPSPPGPPRQ